MDAITELTLAKVRRLNKRNPKKTQGFILLTSAKFAFYGSDLLEHIIFGYTWIPVEYFVPKSRNKYTANQT